MREDCIHPQDRQWCGENKRKQTRLPDVVQNAQQDPPGKKRHQSSHNRTIDNVVEENAASEFDEYRLSQKSEWRVGKGKVAVRYLAQRNSIRVFQDVTEIPEHCESGVLPYHDCGARSCQRQSYQPVEPVSSLDEGRLSHRIRSLHVDPSRTPDEPFAGAHFLADRGLAEEEMTGCKMDGEGVRTIWLRRSLSQKIRVDGSG